MGMEENRPLTREERKQQDMEARIMRLHSLRANDSIYDVVGYPYRETLGSTRKTALPPVSEFLFDHTLGLMYGPGNYSVAYRFCDQESGDEGKGTTMNYCIGPEYAQLHRDYCAQHGLPCYLDSMAVIPGMRNQGMESGLSSLLSEDKIKAFAALMAVIDKMFNRNGGNDMKDILAENYKLLGQVMSGKNSGSSAADKIVEVSVSRMLDQKQPSAREALQDQIDLFKEFQSISNPAIAQERQEMETEQAKTPLEKMLDKALEALPVFLERFGGDEKKAAAQLKAEKPLEVGILKSNQKMKQAAYNALVAQNGVESADRWAQGLGIDLHTVKRPETTQPKQAFNMAGGMRL